MTAAPHKMPDNARTPAHPEVLFGRSAEGFPVALVGDSAFAMLPGRDGGHYLATGWRLARPLADWTRSDFYGHAGEVVDGAAFRSRVEEKALHQQQRAALGRREIASRAATPWGPSQGATIYADGVVCHSTAGHGGFHLDPARNGKVHPLLRAADGFYEEDCCWAAVAQAFPDLFTDLEKAAADQTLRDDQPHAWEHIHGKVLDAGQSVEKDRRVFHRRHGADWIVVSAIICDHEPGFTEVVATVGGDRTGQQDTRRYLVPSAEYGTSGGRFGFVIDRSRHPLYEGPSSFICWNR